MEEMWQEPSCAGRCTPLRACILEVSFIQVKGRPAKVVSQSQASFCRKRVF